MFDFLRRFFPRLVVSDPTESLTLEKPDPRLQQALRSLPTPSPSADFDQKVLSAVAAAPVSRRWHLPAQQMPRFALLSLLIVVLLPGTRTVLRTEVQSQWNFLFGGVSLPLGRTDRSMMLPLGAPDNSLLTPSEQWVTALPLLTGYSKRTEVPMTVQMPAINAWGGHDSTRVSNAANAFQGLREIYKENPKFLAARLRHALGSGIALHASVAQRRLHYAGRPIYSPSWWPPYDGAMNDVDADAIRGSHLEPQNGFFSVIHAAVLFNQKRDVEAVAVLKTLSSKPVWNDYGADEITARYRYEKTRGGMSVLTTSHILALETLPSDALEAIALRAVACAADAEKVGRMREGAAIRVAVLHLAARLMMQGRTASEVDTSSSILRIAQQMVGNYEPGVDFNSPKIIQQIARNHKPRVDYYSLLVGAQNYPASSYKVLPLSLLHAQPWLNWKIGRRERLVAFLEAHGEPHDGKLARTLLDADIQRQRQLSTYRNQSRPQRVTETLLRVGWISLTPLGGSAFLGLMIGGLVSGVYQVSFLKRREEFPEWIIVGGGIGCLVTLFGMVMGGLFHLDVSLVPWPAFAVLVLGVGYLRLRRLHLIALSAPVAIVAGWMTATLIRKTALLIIWTVYTWVDDPAALSLLYPNRAPFLPSAWTAPPLQAWATVPIAFVVLLVTVPFLMSRGQGVTWQTACRRVAVRCFLAASFLALLFSLMVASVACGEVVVEKELLATRLNAGQQFTLPTDSAL